MDDLQVTAMLTDEEISAAAFAQTKNHAGHFMLGAEFARDHYEARLAEDQSLIRSLTRWDSGRMEFTHADDQRISERDQMTVKRAHAALAAAEERSAPEVCEDTLEEKIADHQRDMDEEVWGGDL